ncbi:MAG TPA: class I SAM-dependent methyltransferase [Actinophytocola sp.]|uniref:SAM-dependent methyltransferase n=1 Tax=Actinophytocola sp. TaxID=1872138 RepID=UPI002DDCE78C|nr:class I SAM-dependent methyltransferase [Actinophytocola sp.]HEV2781106.1 class I SAM-dependent methyltransferase [Actinophytocola sp.]
MSAVEQVRERIGELADSAWMLAAVATLLQNPEAELTEEHGAVLGQAGLAQRAGNGNWVPIDGLAALLADPAAAGALNLIGNLRQMVVAASGTTGWANQDDATLRAQGDASQASALPFLSRIVPQVEGLDALLREPGAMLLDVGTGTGGIAVGLCDAIPTLRVVGIDVLPNALDMAKDRVVAAMVADRVELRRQDVAELTDRARFDVAWCPVVFVPQAAVRAALPRLREALKPGGVMIFGIVGYYGATRTDTITAWRVVSNGGTPWTSAEMAAAATSAGFAGVRELPALPGTAAFLVARRPDVADT